MNKQQLENDLSEVAAKHGVCDFIFVYSHLNKPGQVLDEIQIASVSQERPEGTLKPLFQWLRRQIILKLQ